ncbi:PstS family phosphate ABC transporter substrate-binding protein [Metabacillus indicus]|uniref:PstS family phosphate ABC transporter substrate-binding protein n=1 Tax=Metabacillus indicus TaxID=246786 RepID=UPI003CF11909
MKAAKLFMYFGLVPFSLSLLVVISMMAGLHFILYSSIAVFSIGGIAFGYWWFKNRVEGQEFLAFVPLAYTAVLWAIFMWISGGFYGHDSWVVYGILHLPYAPGFFMSAFAGEMSTLFWAPIAYGTAFSIPCILLMLRNHRHNLFPGAKKAFTLFAVIVISLSAGTYIHAERSKTVLPTYGYEHGGGYSSTDLTPYEVTNPNNRLPTLKGESTFIIENSDEMPVLDGAEAAYPVYSAFAGSVYKNVSSVMTSEKEVVSFTNTIYAYERLLSGEADIYFGAEPSKEQQMMAEKAGKELVMTPIGKEAFVFFVHPDNPVENLDVEQIQKIYSGEIKNWEDAGGKKEDIMPFQRPKNSGSQTLLEKIMGNTPIQKPLKEEVVQGMGGIIEQVADYRNVENAIGFSFRYFATGMRKNEDIKLLGVNGIKPDPENISNETYPFTASLYAITLKSNQNKQIEPFLQWMQGPQGQELVEDVGYVKLTDR